MGNIPKHMLSETRPRVKAGFETEQSRKERGVRQASPKPAQSPKSWKHDFSPAGCNAAPSSIVSHQWVFWLQSYLYPARPNSHSGETLSSISHTLPQLVKGLVAGRQREHCGMTRWALHVGRNGQLSPASLARCVASSGVVVGSEFR